MPGVFISYRREDSPGHAGRIFDRVRARFGADVVFMDVTAIDAGVDFVEAIDRAVGTCDVLLAVIGPHWAGAADSAGRKRLDNPNDFIRLEIAGALKRNVRVVPVLVDDARLPGAADLPDDLQPLLRRNAVELRDARWDADIEQLVASLERIVKPQEEPLRLERQAPRRLRWIAALAALLVSGGAGIVWGPRACAPEPDINVAATAPTTTAPTTAAPVVQPPVTEKPPSPRPEPPPVPDVVGRQLSEAREILRRAGVGVARVLYRDDRTKAIDVVVLQSEVRSSAGSAPAVALTAVARAAVVINHRPEDGDVARRLLSALTASRSTDGVVVRTLEVQTLRSESIARVNYSDSALVGTAADMAKDANAWLAQNDPGRPTLTATLHPPVVARTIVIGLPERAPAKPPPASPAALPDVRGLDLAEARRKLFAAGVTAFDYKWSDDRSRKPMEVVDQSEIPSLSGGRRVVLSSVAKGTVVVFYLANDAPIAERLAEDMRRRMRGLGILVRPLRQSVVKPDLVGKVVSADVLKKDGLTIASFASSWLTKELGRPIRIRASTDKMGARELMFGLPALQ